MTRKETVYPNIPKKTMKIIEPTIFHDFDDVLKGEEVNISEKRFKDAAFFYENASNMDENTIMYHVYMIGPKENQAGSLNWGLSVLYPVLVNGECNMTRGHWHNQLESDEIYVGQSGNGLLMLMDKTGNTWCEKVSAGSVHYISGQLAHRLINTGDEALKVICCWPVNAGHDYQAVEQRPFAYRVFKKDNQLEFKKVD